MRHHGSNPGSTYTTTCPVTETVTGPGETYTKTYVTTSVVKVSLACKGLVQEATC